MKQIMEFKEFEGKTIDRIKGTGVDNNLIITFTDKTFAVISPFQYFEDIDIQLVQIEISDVPKDVLIELGIYTAAEIDNFYAQKKQNAEWDRQNSEFLHYQRLKEKWEGKEPPVNPNAPKPKPIRKTGGNE